MARCIGARRDGSRGAVPRALRGRRGEPPPRRAVEPSLRRRSRTLRAGRRSPAARAVLAGRRAAAHAWSVERLRAAVVTEDPLARSALSAMLSDRMDVIAAAPADAALAAPAVDAVLVDGAATDRAALRDIAAALPVVVLAQGPDEAAEALAAGARAVVLRDAGPDRLAAALAAAAHGLVALDRSLGPWLRPPPPARDGEGLTPREVEVLALLAEGLPNKAIARRLGVSERTAKFHVESILGKLGAESRSEAIVLAVHRGLVAI